MPVYFIRAGEHGPVKIGVAADPARRMVNLQTSNSSPLQIIRLLDGHRADERRIHDLFADRRLAGEWFAFDPSMLEADLVIPDIPLPPRRSESQEDILRAGLGEPYEGHPRTVAHTIYRIRAYRLSRRWSIQRFGAAAGIGESTIRQMDSRTWNPTVAILRRLEAAIPAEFMSEGIAA